MCTLIKQMLYLHINFLELSTQRSTFLCPLRLCLPFTTIFSCLAELSCVLIDFPVSTQGFLVSACVTRGSIVWESYFLDKNMFMSSYWFDSVWNSFQLTISAEPKFVCYIKQNCNMIDGISHQSWFIHRNFKKLECQFLMMQNLMSKILG